MGLLRVEPDGNSEFDATLTGAAARDRSIDGPHEPTNVTAVSWRAGDRDERNIVTTIVPFTHTRPGIRLASNFTHTRSEPIDRG